ncbi:hypothetical protein JAAARDRAFT_199640 [Jaapia argillacea MUCL 33604]|uniref:Uncharacterized protein n=1 Tax=Jaapia argillacea MUCL 33604 TaxID=933084 RepID=A0A067P7N9_9AGAM|nr:hypothetical protein JAAARDRAFT_199640 [Jaapia argillacea MUCL 33604]
MLILDYMDQLARHFGENLKGDGKEAERKATDEAHKPHNVIIESLPHHSQYRALLQRDGHYIKDLNQDLANLFSRHVMSCWRIAFPSNLFRDLSDKMKSKSQEIVDEVIASIGIPSLEDRARAPLETLSLKRREASRAITPAIKGKMQPGYHTALEIKGLGSFRAQQESMTDFIRSQKNLFSGLATLLSDDLQNVCCTEISIQLTQGVEVLTRKVESNLTDLWETKEDDELTMRRLEATIASIQENLRQWQETWIDEGMKMDSD